MRLCLPILLCVSLLTGCVVTDTGVTNPVPGLSTVAVAPFLNLSTERAVDGRQFAEAYYAELQKVPGFEVVPVGVVETAMVQHGLEEMRGPEDAVRLAKILNVDAVVVGAVTDYKAYAPPRMGLKVSWYSPYDWSFTPGIPIDPLARTRLENEQELRENMYREANRRPLELGDCCTCPPGECDGRCLAQANCDCEHGLESCQSGQCSGLCSGSDCQQCSAGNDGMSGWFHQKSERNKVRWERFKKEMKDPFELHKGPREDKLRVPVPWPDYRGQSPDNPSAEFGHSMTSNQPMALSATGTADQVRMASGHAVESFQNTTWKLQLSSEQIDPQQSAYQQVAASQQPQFTANSQMALVDGPLLFLPGSSSETVMISQMPQAPPVPDSVKKTPVEPQPALSVPKQTEPEPIVPPVPKSTVQPLPQKEPVLEMYQVTPGEPLELPMYQEALNSRPFMEYSRMFDATDADLVANFRDYYELSGDPRSGSWESRLHRTDDYIRFVSHLMIKEMLMLHGGEARRRIIFVPRKFK
ncbi:hypothetical protein Pla110_21590 [Polystyrenella longa]|uniref:Uncharacterized protein n=1 Tax=Polystyrenella longa TaxID=2528007 RepID=A0A518CMH6_9PLAN|nr:hypothetical protein [Polystyrenella longa]QDU80429.1 hypothetical protein Pla110_21590 [Polystyrenella longa]